MGGRRLNRPIVGMAAHPSDAGYWLVASDGGVFSFGVEFFGSEGDETIPTPVVGMAAAGSGEGYWLVGRDGGVYPHGVTDHGSAADHDTGAAAPVVGIAAAGLGGYWVAHGAPRVVRSDDTGAEVLSLQRRFRELGYWLGPVEGEFGELTKQAVHAFQMYEGLAVDGLVGPGTRTRLRTQLEPRRVPPAATRSR